MERNVEKDKVTYGEHLLGLLTLSISVENGERAGTREGKQYHDPAVFCRRVYIDRNAAGERAKAWRERKIARQSEHGEAMS